jgi:hypothetical protein
VLSRRNSCRFGIAHEDAADVLLQELAASIEDEHRAHGFFIAHIIRAPLPVRTTKVVDDNPDHRKKVGSA